MAAKLSKAIENKIKADFPPEYHEEIMHLITHSGFEGILDEERIQNAMLTLSEGNIDRFRRCIERAKVDYRDILMGAENRILGRGVRRDIRSETERKGSPPDRAYSDVVIYLVLAIFLFLGIIAGVTVLSLIGTKNPVKR